MQAWPLQASMQYCKNRIRSILTWALSVGIVQHTRGTNPKQVQEKRLYGKINHGL